MSLAAFGLVWGVSFAPVAALAARDGKYRSAEQNTQQSPSPTATPEGSSAPKASPSVPPQAPSASPKTGPAKPTGADAQTYTLNSTTGLWENGVYSWDPATGQTKPLMPQTYSYNPSTKMWDTTEWRYEAASGSYKPQVVSTSDAPSGAAKAVETSDTGAGSASGGTFGSVGQYDGFFDGRISNQSRSTATSGDVNVTENTKAGDAASGTASVVETLINSLGSYWGLSDNDLLTFTSNLVGSMIGDILFDPGQLQQSSTVADQKTRVTQKDSGSIANDVDLDARSGSVGATDNTEVGNAASGDAYAVANLVNTINSAIAARQSFVGTINIQGDYSGDILLPPGVLNTLLGSSAPSASVSTSQFSDQSQLAAVLSKQGISNNIDSAAQSGGVNVADNSRAGNATSGDAATTLSILNLTGRQVIGKDMLLVFINVAGKWTGVLMNAPSGSTAAALGDGITTDTTSTTRSEINAQSDGVISNTIKARAQSGDVNVSRNTRAGDATSGTATTGVNIANILDSDFSLTDWFGVLFINVMGNWFGSFGVQTPEASPEAAAAQASLDSGQVKVFRVAVKSSRAGEPVLEEVSTASLSRSLSPEQPQAAQASAATQLGRVAGQVPVAEFDLSRYRLVLIFGGLALALFGGERLWALTRGGKKPKGPIEP